jgi:biopolymer transport protein ExbD
MRARRAVTTGPISDINLTPFIDVLLVLLILFMVALPAAQRSLQASLPRPDPGPEGARPGPSTIPVLSVHTADFELNTERHATRDSLEHALQEMAPRVPNHTIIVKSDGDTTYGRVIEAMDLAVGAGFTRIGAATAEAPAAVQ